MDMHKFGIEVTQQSSLHKYRTELPNIIFDMDLDPYEFKAYCVLKKTAGDRGSCFKSNETLCKEIGCQKPKFIEIKKSLSEKGLIKICKQRHKNGGNMPDLVTILDIWDLNMKTMSERIYESKGGGNLRLPGVVIQDYQGGNRRLHKQDPNEEEPKRTTTEQKNRNAVVFSNRDMEERQTKKKKEEPKIYPILFHVDILDTEKYKLTLDFTEEQVTHAVNWTIEESKKKKIRCLIAMLKWACKEQPEIVKTKEQVADEHKRETEKLLKENHAIAKPYHGKQSPSGKTKVEVHENHVIFLMYKDKYQTTHSIDFYQKDFKDKMYEALMMRKIEIVEES